MNILSYAKRKIANYDSHNADVIKSMNEKLEPIRRRYFADISIKIPMAAAERHAVGGVNIDGYLANLNETMFKSFMHDIAVEIETNIIGLMKEATEKHQNEFNDAVCDLFIFMRRGFNNSSQPRINAEIELLRSKIKALFKIKAESEQLERKEFRWKTAREKGIAFFFSIIGVLIGLLLNKI